MEGRPRVESKMSFSWYTFHVLAEGNKYRVTIHERDYVVSIFSDIVNSFVPISTFYENLEECRRLEKAILSKLINSLMVVDASGKRELAKPFTTFV